APPLPPDVPLALTVIVLDVVLPVIVWALRVTVPPVPETELATVSVSVAKTMLPLSEVRLRLLTTVESIATLTSPLLADMITVGAEIFATPLVDTPLQVLRL